jgi:uncharacterized membrane protein
MADNSHDNLPADVEALAASIADAANDENRAAVVKVTQQISNFHSGPLPDPESLRVYAELIPNGADRIMNLVESEARYRCVEEQKQFAHEARQTIRGQWMAFALTLLFAAVGTYLGLAGHDWLAGTVFTTTIGAVVAIFVVGDRSQARDDRRARARDAIGGAMP